MNTQLIKHKDSKEIITRELYLILGIGVNATNKEIKEAFRNKSKQYHPDIGGDEELFKKICEAYNILINEEKRSRYDDGEDPIDILKNDNNESLKVISELLLGVLQHLDPDNNNIIKVMNDELDNNIKRLDDEIDKHEKIKTRLQKTIQNTIKKGKSNLIKYLSDKHIKHIDIKIKDIKDARDGFKKAKKLLDNYEYDMPEQPLWDLGQFRYFTN